MKKDFKIIVHTSSITRDEILDMFKNKKIDNWTYDPSTRTLTDEFGEKSFTYEISSTFNTVEFTGTLKDPEKTCFMDFMTGDLIHVLLAYFKGDIRKIEMF